MRLFSRILVAILALFVGVAVASAQTSNGTVIGLVTDTTGGAIVGATITITSVDTGAVRTTLTNDQGTYRIESVSPGVYNVSGSAPGFQTTVNQGLTVPGSAIISSGLVLKVGQASDKVEVSADNAVLNTDNGQISGTISEQEISSLPIASLNPYELALTLPGVTTVAQGGEFTNGTGFTVGGGRPRSNNFLIEGQDNNDASIQGQGLTPGNDEAVKEVVIIENAYTAEYGHGAGSVSNLLYKNGTNDFHGAVFERIQNNAIDAVDHQDHFNNVTEQTKYRENMPGFRIGGPIIHNKLFGFASYQWDFYRSSANLNVLAIPTAAGLDLLKKLPSNPYLNNLLTAYGSLVGTINPKDIRPSIALGPDPVTGVDRGIVQVGTVQRNLGANSDAPELDLKGDYIMSSKDTLNLRFIRTRYTAPFDVFNFKGQLPGFDSDQDGTSHNAGIVEAHVFSPNVVNELRASYSRIGFTFGLPASTTSNSLAALPVVELSGVEGYGIYPGTVPQGRFHNTYQLQDTVSWTHGKHFLKFGTDLSDTRVRDAVPFNFNGIIGYADDTRATPNIPVPGGGTQSFIYPALSNLIDDYGGPSSTVTQNFGNPTARPRLVSQNYFAQDTYRPIPTLSIDLGFRYEYNGAPFNAVGTPYPGIDFANLACFPLTAGSNCNTKQQADGSQWGPRAGIAWSPDFLGNGHKSVIRAGFGVFYDVVYTNIIDNIQASAPNTASPVITSSSTSSATSRGKALWFEQFANLNHNPRPTNTAFPIADHLLSPRTMHWNLNLEQELPWATTLQVGYVGERGTHLYGNSELNPYVNDYFYASRVIPTRGRIVVRDNSGDSEYTGLWSELDHKFNHNFLFRASYTLGRSFDDSSEIFTFNNESSFQFSRYPTQRGTSDWGPSAYDHRQRLVLAYIWTPGTWHAEGGAKVLGNIVNHWAVAGITQFQTGSPENVENGFDVDGDGLGNDRPMLSNPKAPLASYAVDNAWFTGESDGSVCSGPSWWFTSDDCHPVTTDSVHWIVPAYGTYPSKLLARNSLYSKGLQQWDINIQRSFPIHEKISLDFRGELFNAFNHGINGIQNTNLAGISPGIVTDEFNDNGTNIFGDPAPAVSGHRHSRFFIRIQF